MFQDDNIKKLLLCIHISGIHCTILLNIVNQTNSLHFNQMLTTYQYKEANYNVYSPYFPESHHIQIPHAH